MVGMLGTAFATGKRGKSVRKKLEAASESHIKNLEEKYALVGEIAEKTVKENVEKISESPLYEEVFKYYGLSGIFASAAAKHIKTAKEEAAVKVAPAEKKKRPAVRDKQTPDYKDLNGL
jgi:hypothetical protein